MPLKGAATGLGIILQVKYLLFQAKLTVLGS
jgi:hypothetical protein